MINFRAEETQKEYAAYLLALNRNECQFCSAIGTKQEVARHGKYVVLQNRFPYDAVFGEHLLIVPIKHQDTFVNAERDEISEIVEKHYPRYAAFENLPCSRSVKNHAHVHLVLPKGKK